MFEYRNFRTQSCYHQLDGGSSSNSKILNGSGTVVLGWLRICCKARTQGGSWITTAKPTRIMTSRCRRGGGDCRWRADFRRCSRGCGVFATKPAWSFTCSCGCWQATCGGSCARCCGRFCRRLIQATPPSRRLTSRRPSQRYRRRWRFGGGCSNFRAIALVELPQLAIIAFFFRNTRGYSIVHLNNITYHVFDSMCAYSNSPALVFDCIVHTHLSIVARRF